MSDKPFGAIGEMLAETGFNAFGLMTPKQVFDTLKRHEKEIANLKRDIKTLRRQVKHSTKKSSQNRKRNTKKKDISDDDDYDELDF